MQEDHLGALREVTGHVISGIVKRRYMPGDRITEPALAEELGLSRTPVRHGLAALVADGVLVKEKGRRGYVVPRLTRSDMLEVFSARELLEGYLAFRAAQEADASDVGRLKEINAREQAMADLGDLEGYCAANDEFHMAVAEMGGNGYLLKAFRLVYWRSQLYVHALIDFLPPSEDGGSGSLAEHRLIVDAIERRDAEGARRAAEEHLRSTRGYRIAFGGREELFLDMWNGDRRRGRVSRRGGRDG
ncbi:transcriptional regulator [Thermanaerovibrio velox DSM 12556]|uniref:Transcriptional regulator n=1 Tax=Thermanaerovibrio velox DSM 12556 TaxID=926567 RepID=H0UQL2_9BACT|nr:GntR family transcriptional regulator [Thermanaerovibrio velox]EHM10776.1 transcriptional regulator [Thermanaerovibrio velox DSM 12556]